MIRILLIDDERINADLLEGMLCGEPDVRVEYESNPAHALAAAARFAPTVILVDLRMPGADGFEVIGTLKRDPQTGRIPVLMLSSEESPNVKATGFAAGASDYLVKWPDRIELLARVRAHSNAFCATREHERATRALEASQLALLRRTEELAAAQACLHEAQKMEAIGRLTSGIAHDFNNVLQLINGHLQLMRVQDAGDERSKRRIDAASDGVRRGARLAAQLLSFARTEPLGRAVIDPARFLRGCDAAILDGCAVSIADDVHPVALDPVQFENVLAGLVANAREAIGSGGSVAVDVDNFVAGSTGGALAAGDYVRIRVTDTGAGMDDETLRCAFEPFFTTKGAARQSGLGLSLAFAFARQSGGHIALDSKPGEGCTAILYLPRAHEQHDPRETAPADAGNGATVLVVEDEAAVRVASVEVLRRLGYRVLEAADGPTALGIIDSGAPIDLVFTDVVMPGAVRGSDIAAAARTRLPGARVLFASGYPRDDLMKDGCLDHGTELLRKPYRLDDMARKVADLIGAARQSGA